MSDLSCDLSSFHLDRKWCRLRGAMQYPTGHSGRCLATTGRLLQDSGFYPESGHGLHRGFEVWAPQGGPKALVLGHSHLPRDPHSPNPPWGQLHQRDRAVAPQWPPSPPGRQPPWLHLVVLHSFLGVCPVDLVIYRRFLSGLLSLIFPPACVVSACPGQVCVAGLGRRRPRPRSVEHDTPPSDCGFQTTPPSCNGIPHTLLCSRILQEAPE